MERLWGAGTSCFDGTGWIQWFEAEVTPSPEVAKLSTVAVVEKQLFAGVIEEMHCSSAVPAVLGKDFPFAEAL